MPQLKTKKISELTEAQSYSGLHILATDSNNESKRYAFGDLIATLYNAINGKAATSHTHTIAQVRNLQASLTALAMADRNLQKQIQALAEQTANAAARKDVVEVADYAELEALESPQEEVIYITTDDNKFYLYQDGEFVNVKNNDGILYISSLDELLDDDEIDTSELDEGVYTVFCFRYAQGAGTYDIYALNVTKVSRRGRMGIVTATVLTLSNLDGWADVETDENGDPYWSWHKYVYEDALTILLAQKANITHTHTSSEIMHGSNTVASIIQELYDEIDALAIESSEQIKQVVEVETYSDLEAIEDPQSEILYVVLETQKIYIYDEDEGEFVDVTNSNVNNTIYVRNLGALIDMELDSGIYAVCLSFTSNAGGRSTYYSLTVNSVYYRRTRTSSTTMFLSNRDGWAEIVTDEENNQSWSWHYYAYQSNEGATLEFAEESDVEMFEPLPSDMVTEIVNGEFDESDIAPFTGSTQYRPMTEAEVTAIVQQVFNQE